MRRRIVRRVAAAACVLTLPLSGCGSSGAKSAATGSTTATRPASSPSARPGSAKGPSVTTGPVHATLTGATHSPKAGKMWHYTVRVTDASGKPMSGAVETVFTFLGQVVGKESPPIHTLKHGLMRDHFPFPRAAIGHPIAMVTVVHTKAGSVALRWPVSVRP